MYIYEIYRVNWVKSINTTSYDIADIAREILQREMQRVDKNVDKRVRVART